MIDTTAKLLRFSILPVVCLALSACGGGSSSGGGTPVDPAGGATSSVSGSVNLAARTNFDSDINDPGAPLVDNGVASRAQAIDNLVVLQGFASLEPTGRSGDAFESRADTDDFYRVNLQAGQRVQLQVVDFTGNAGNRVFSGDLDVGLYDSDLTLVDFSITATEFEQVVAPADGLYYIRVQAFSGASKYVLKLLTTANTASVPNTFNTDFVTGQAIVTYEATANRSAAQKLGAQYQAAAEPTSGPVLFKFDQLQKAALSEADSEIAATNPETMAKLDTLRTIKELNKQSIVSRAEPNYRRYAFATPNDPFYSLQWHYPNIRLPQAWDLSTGQSVIVAVVDSGVVTALPDLQANMLPGYDFVDDLATAADGDGRDSDPTDPGSGLGPGSNSWHGTHVAGTVAAVTNNGSGVSGVAWNSKIIPVRALGRGGGTAFDVMESIKYAAGLPNVSGTTPARRADIINLSLGGGGFVQAEADVMRQITDDLGIIIIAAAGNENTSQPSYPASYDGVVSVSATDIRGDRAPYSNFGSTIDIAAPGGDTSADRNGDGYVDGVLSTVIDESTGTRTPGYRFLQGTSMAAPHVAGVAALMKSVAPQLTSTQFTALLQSGQLTDEAGPAGRDNTYGYGIVNALKAVQAAVSLGNGSGIQTPIMTATPSEVTLGASASAPLNIANAGTGTPTLVSVQSDADWLQVSAQSTDASGLGQYAVSANRSLMDRGTYVGTLSFNFSNAATLRVSVTATAGDVSTVGRLGPHYILLYDVDNESVAAQLRGSASNGVIPYRFSDIPAGRYAVIGGTDIDRDGFICDDGEACGLYPTAADSEILNLSGSNLSGIDFITNITSGLSQLTNQSRQDEAPLASRDGLARQPD